MRVFITKYWITEGVIEAEAKQTIVDGMIECNIPGVTWPFSQCFHRGEWFEKLTDALDDATERKDKRIKSLCRQVEKLQRMEIHVVQR